MDEVFRLVSDSTIGTTRLAKANLGLYLKKISEVFRMIHGSMVVTLYIVLAQSKV